MARKIIWSMEAVEDLDSILKYIERDSPYYAQATISKIFDISNSLINFSQMGRIVPELKNNKIREILIYSYRLIYSIESKQIVIAAVIHDKRLLSPFVSRFNR